ncbi:MAG: DUF4194 domain-containing protein [Spirochaetaceae bacterium]|jgi:hypothetical protein|nr:DUF4194 domain-containing protein [Spirochaetaceae bacterium]
MLDELYGKLNSSEKEDFRRLTNYLLSHTYLVRHEYQPSQQMTLPNRDYQIVSRLFPVFQEYFELSGWRLEKDDHYGIISLSNTYAHNRLQLNRFTTIFLYVCRLIYEEDREEVSGTFHMVKTSTQEVIGKMNTLELLEKRRTTQKERIDAQRTLAHFNIIRKMETSPWDGDGNLILILPSVLSIIPNCNINTMKAELEEFKITGAENQKEPETGG